MIKLSPHFDVNDPDIINLSEKLEKLEQAKIDPVKARILSEDASLLEDLKTVMDSIKETLEGSLEIENREADQKKYEQERAAEDRLRKRGILTDPTKGAENVASLSARKVIKSVFSKKK